jgi:hypothetical protein
MILTSAVEYPDFCHAIAQIEQLAGVLLGVFELFAQVIEEERVQHL